MGCCKRELAGGPRLREQRRRRLLPLLLLLLILAVVADPPLAAASFFFGGDADSVRLFTILTITRTRPAPPLTILPLLFRAQDCSRTCESERCTGKSPRVASSDRGRWLDFFCFLFYLSVRPTDRLTALPCTPSLAAAPLMRYGKYCGVSYTGCPGEDPCDALDACCMIHDACIQATDSTTSASIYTFWNSIFLLLLLHLKSHFHDFFCVMDKKNPCWWARADDYLNMLCNQSLLDCVAVARSSSLSTFVGNSCNVTEVADEITSVVEVAVFAKRILHKP
jgi:hypothetical protein